MPSERSVDQNPRCATFLGYALVHAPREGNVGHVVILGCSVTLDAARATARHQMLWWLVGCCIIGSVLIWMLWVLPIARSVSNAEPTPLGQEVAVDEGTYGVWMSGRAAMLGVTGCASDGELTEGPSLDWEDTLWWMTPREGFSQVRRVSGGTHLHCESTLDSYEGEYLIARDVFGSRQVWIGRMGERSGTVLAVGAVGLPLLSIFLTPILIVQSLRRLRDQREHSASTA